MLPLNFYLRATGGATQPIYLFATIGRERLRFSVNEKINPVQWNTNAQRAKVSRSNPELTNLNHRLNQIKEDVSKLIREAELKNEILTPSAVKEIINNYLKPVVEAQPEKTDFFKFISEYITGCANKKTPSTIQTYKATKDHLQNFAAYAKIKIDFENIDLAFYDKFTNYLISSLGHSKNTVGKYVKILKTFMSEAAERNLHTNYDYRKKGFTVTKEDVENIYLTIDELNILFNLDLKENPKLDRVRDLFLIGCYTGLRFSDFSRLNTENIQGNTISIKTQKTGTSVAIPIRAEVAAILRKYEGNLPRAYSNQKMNSYLKELGEAAELNTTVTKTHSKGANKVHTTRSKFEMITTHTARRSFATNAFLEAVPTLQIMKITGHKTETSFMKYIKMSAEDNARKLQQHPFFNNALPATPLKAVS